MARETVIIGGGLSGLVAAALLAKKGDHVTVLEKGNSLGGLCQTIEVESNNYYLGAHHLGGISSKGPIGEILNFLEIDYEDTFVEVDALSILSEGDINCLPVKIPALKNYILTKFPAEVETASFIQKLSEYQQAFIKNDESLLLKMFMETSQKSFDQFLSEYFTNKSLKKQLLSFGPGYGAVLGQDSAFTVLSLIISYSIGACYLKGGPQKLIKMLEKRIIENGGVIMKETECLELLISDNRSVTGVRYKNVNGSISQLKADNVISTVFPLDIIPKECKGLRSVVKMRKVEKGPSVFRLFAELKEEVEELSSDNTFLGDSGEEIDRESLYLKATSKNLPICMISLPHKGDPSFNENRKTIMFTFLTHNQAAQEIRMDSVLSLIRKSLPNIAFKMKNPFFLGVKDYSKIVSIEEGSVFGWIRTGKSIQHTNSFSPIVKGVEGLFICGNWSTDFGVYGGLRSAYKIYHILEGVAA